MSSEKETDYIVIHPKYTAKKGGKMQVIPKGTIFASTEKRAKKSIVAGMVMEHVTGGKVQLGSKKES